MRAVAGEEQGLGTDATSRFENHAAGRVTGAFMQQETEPGCLVKQPRGLAVRPPMHVWEGTITHKKSLIKIAPIT
jgi:hypothetical protein